MFLCDPSPYNVEFYFAMAPTLQYKTSILHEASEIPEGPHFLRAFLLPNQYVTDKRRLFSRSNSTPFGALWWICKRIKEESPDSFIEVTLRRVSNQPKKAWNQNPMIGTYRDHFFGGTSQPQIWGLQNSTYDNHWAPSWFIQWGDPFGEK